MIISFSYPVFYATLLFWSSNLLIASCSKWFFKLADRVTGVDKDNLKVFYLNFWSNFHHKVINEKNTETMQEQQINKLKFLFLCWDSICKWCAKSNFKGSYFSFRNNFTFWWAQKFSFESKIQKLRILHGVSISLKNTFIVDLPTIDST